MAQVILLKRGLKANLPAMATVGEPLLTTDTRELFLGTGTGIQKISDVEFVATKAGLPATGISGKVYIVEADETQGNKSTLYRYNGASYTQVGGGQVSFASLTDVDSYVGKANQALVVRADESGITYVDVATQAELDAYITKLASTTATEGAGLVGISGTNFVATTVQGALDEVDGRLDSVEGEISTARGAEASLDARLDGMDTIIGGKVSKAGDTLTGFLSTHANPTDPMHVANKQYVDNAISGLDFQKDVNAVQVDATLDPTLTPITGDRYVITNALALHANFGTIAGLENGDIVEYNGSAFVVSYDVSVMGEGTLTWDKSTNTYQRYDGTAWSEFGGLAGVTDGTGLSKSGNTINVNVDNTTIEVDGSDNLHIKASGVGTTELANDAVTAAKIGADVAGNGLVQNGTTGALDVNVGDGVEVATDAITVKIDGTTLAKSATGLKVNANGITANELASGIDMSAKNFTASNAVTWNGQTIDVTGIADGMTLKYDAVNSKFIVANVIDGGTFV